MATGNKNKIYKYYFTLQSSKTIAAKQGYCRKLKIILFQVMNNFF